MTDSPARTLRASTLAAAALAAVAVAIGAVLGDALSGAAVGVGLLLGSGNGFLVRRAVGADLPFTFTSLSRLLLLTFFGIGIGLLLGNDRVALVVLGLAGAQLLLASAAAREMARR